MKRLFTLFQIIVLIATTANSQVVEVWKNGIMQANVTAPDSIRMTDNVLSREEIQAWAEQHVDSLASIVWQRMLSEKSMVRDPDKTREVFRSIGYNGRNVFQFLLGGAVIDNAILDSLIAKAKSEGNNKVVAIAGHSSAGKSSSIKKFDDLQALTNAAGIVLDEVWTDRNALKTTLQDLKEKGFDDQTVILVYRRPQKSFKRACERFLEEGRVIGLRFFIGDYLFTSYLGYVSDFMETELANMGVKRIYIDNNKPTSIVTAAEAAEWDYTLSDVQKQKMAYNLYKFIYDNKDKLSYRDAWALFYDE